MEPVGGKISDKIRALFPKGHSAHRPPADRSDSPKRGQKIPRQRVQGESLGKPDRKKK